MRNPETVKRKKEIPEVVRFEIPLVLFGGPSLSFRAGWEVTRCEWIVGFWQRRKKSPVPESEAHTCWQKTRERESGGERDRVVWWQGGAVSVSGGNPAAEVAKWW